MWSRILSPERTAAALCSGTLPVFGVTRGMNPILGYSVGAKDKKRFLETRNLAYKLASITTVIAGCIFVFAPQVILRMLNATPEMTEIGMTAYRILGLPLFVYAINVVSVQIFPPAKKSYISMGLTLLRQVGFLVPLCKLFSGMWGMTGVWIGYAATDYLNFFVVMIANIWFKKAVLDSWEDKQ